MSVYAEVATIVSGVASLVAVVLAIRALNDANRTAGVLVESQRLLESAQERAEREQAARVLTVGHDLARRIQIFWQRTLVDLKSPPTPGGSLALVRHALELMCGEFCGETERALRD